MWLTMSHSCYFANKKNVKDSLDQREGQHDCIASDYMYSLYLKFVYCKMINAPVSRDQNLDLFFLGWRSQSLGYRFTPLLPGSMNLEFLFIKWHRTERKCGENSHPQNSCVSSGEGTLLGDQSCRFEPSHAVDGFEPVSLSSWAPEHCTEGGWNNHYHLQSCFLIKTGSHCCALYRPNSSKWVLERFWTNLSDWAPQVT